MRIASVVVVVALLAAAPSALGSSEASQASVQPRITIFARPTHIGWNQLATLFGTAQGAGPEDVVAIEARECGSGFYRALFEAHVNAGGGWTQTMGAWVTTSFRATWKSFSSPAITIRKQAGISLVRSRSGPQFVAAVTARRSFWQKRIEIQRRQAGGWRTLKTVVLTDSVRSTGLVSAAAATFRLGVPKGTLLRAVLPQAQAKPCYVASTSRVLRT